METKNWKLFYLKELFDIDTGKDLIYSELTDGEFPVIGHKAENNGITAMTCYLPKHKLYDYTKTISLADRGNFFATIQTHNFYVGTRVKALVSKFSVPIECLLFICVLINNEQYRFSYGRNCCDRIDVFQIKLPVDNNDNPNWLWIEDYVKKTLVPKLPKKIKQVWKKNFDKTPLSSNKLQLNTKEWKWFRVGDYFDAPYKATSYNAIDLINCKKENENSIAYITRTDVNNGCKDYVVNEDFVDVESGNAITIGDTTATIYYQEDEFICGDHMVVLRSKHLNKFVGLFIVSLLNKERFRYNYGRAFNKGIIANTKLKLPALLNNKNEYEPDWQWMEDYIKGLPYSGCL